ncbi:MAG: hypothetical protein PUI67_05660 [Collinsella sp.]|nr:hypothetical protein [Collinsella sp.]MDY6149684.1 hypothetical protein [Collinsella sp.]
MELAEIDTSLVTAGAPADGGCCWVSFNLSAALPTDATTKMSTLTDFESVGDLSENGYTESKSVSSTEEKGWHGTPQIVLVDSETNKYKLEFTEVLRPTVAKIRYGSKNVQVNEDGTIKQISGKPTGIEYVAMVIDELMSNGWLSRTVVKKAAIDSFDDVAHNKGKRMVYGMEFTAVEVGGSCFERYFAKPASTEASGS